MIPNNNTRTTTVADLGDAEEIELGVDPENFRHIMELLTNLYSDEELACIREYSTNAFDSHIVAGQKRPIEVSTPTRLSPVFRVKDYGVGMNKEDIKRTFALYGASTKRKDKRQNGAMGIGGKAALGYGSSFTVVGVKNGIKTTMMISRKDDGSASVKVMATAKTTEPNGVEIQVPARDYNEFESKAKNFFKFWAPGTVLLNGKEPDRDDLKKMTDRIFFHNGDVDYVVMGNVAYELERAHSISYNDDRVAVFVTMNGDDEVVFTPSREGLIYNGITTNALKGVQEEYDNSIKEFIKSEVENAPSFIDAYKALRDFNRKYRNMINLSDIKYNGLDLSPTWLLDDNDKKVSATMWYTGRTRNAVSTSYLSVDTLADDTALFITGYTASGVNSSNKARIKAYARKHEISLSSGWYGKSVMLISDASLPDPARTAGFGTVDWKTILKETKAERVIGGGGFSYGEAYDVWVPGSGWQVEELDEDDEILFYSPADTNLSPDMRDRILKEKPDVKFVEARSNRHAKLQRLYKNAKPYHMSDWTKKFAVEDFDALTDETKAILEAKYMYDTGYFNGKWRYSFMDEIPSHRVESIQDPELRSAAALYKTTDPVVGWAEQDARYRTLTDEWKKKRLSAKDWNSVYPLCNWGKYPTQTVEYINDLYNKNKEN